MHKELPIFFIRLLNLFVALHHHPAMNFRIIVAVMDAIYAIWTPALDHAFTNSSLPPTHLWDEVATACAFCKLANLHIRTKCKRLKTWEQLETRARKLEARKRNRKSRNSWRPQVESIGIFSIITMNYLAFISASFQVSVSDSWISLTIVSPTLVFKIFHLLRMKYNVLILICS